MRLLTLLLLITITLPTLGNNRIHLISTLNFRNLDGEWGEEVAYKRGPLSYGAGEYRITILFTPKEYKTTPTLFLGPSAYPTIVKANSNQLYSWGGGPNSSFRANYRANAILLSIPPRATDDFTRDTATIIFWSDGEKVSLGDIYIDEEKTVKKAAFKQTFFNSTVITGMAIASIFIMVLFFFHFSAGGFKEWDLFFMSMIALIFITGYMNFILNGEYFPELLIFQMSRISLTLMPFALINFVRYFLKIWTHSRLFEIIPLVVAIPMIVLIIHADTKFEVNDIFGNASTYIMNPELLIIIILLLIGAIKKNTTESLVILFALIIFIIAALMDVHNIAQSVEPWVWYTPYGYFITVLTTTIVIVLRQQSLKIEMAEYQTKLEGAKKTAENEALVREEFIKNIAHELRTPLNGILGTMSNINRPEDINKTILSQLKSSIKKIQYSLSNIFSYVSIKSEEITVRSYHFNLLESIEEVIQHYREIIATTDNKIVLNINRDEFPGSFECDAERIILVCNNILNNAIKYNKQGDIKCSAVYKDEKFTFKVEDNSGGMDHEIANELNNLFVSEKFKQLESSKGLGLTISHYIAKALGGKIKFTVVQEEGVIFTFSLPLKAVSTKINTTGEERKILIVDDDIINQAVLVKLLKRENFKVSTVANGLDAVESVRREHFSIILMDVQMPLMNGYDATRLIKKISPNIPIVGVTANGSYNEAKEAGMDDLVEKPIHHKLLLSTIYDKLTT